MPRRSKDAQDETLMDRGLRVLRAPHEQGAIQDWFAGFGLEVDVDPGHCVRSRIRDRQRQLSQAGIPLAVV